MEYFGMGKEPFADSIASKDLLQLPGTLSVKRRMDYILDTGGIMLVTGDVGSGKSTAIRWSLDQYHKSEIDCCYVVASSAPCTELYKQLCWGMHVNIRGGNRGLLLKSFKDAVTDNLLKKKSKTIVVIDEASLLRLDVFAELHTINQFDFDSAKRFSLVLAGRNPLVEKLEFRTSLPLASRVMARSHLSSLDEEEMKSYIAHHLKICGVKEGLFNQNAMTAIWQGSGGLLRRANLLAKGSLVACMEEKKNQVDEEHVRLASTELI